MGKLWGNMDFYVETGNFVDFLSTFWQILRFPFGLFLIFSCFFLFCRFTVFILPAYTVPGNKCCCLLLKTKSYYWNTELLLALLPVPFPSGPSGRLFLHRDKYFQTPGSYKYREPGAVCGYCSRWKSLLIKGPTS